MSLRAARPGDAAAIRRIMRSTFAMGRPLPEGIVDFDAYEDLALGWYLGPGLATSAVHITDDGAVAGYAVVCTDHAGFARWQRTAALRFLRRVVPPLLAGSYDTFTDRFYRLRIRDGWDLWRAGPRPVGAHAHFNLAAGSRGGLVVRDFVAFIDSVCADAGVTHWLGEMNSRRGSRSRVIERYGNRIVHRSHNHTLSWLAGEDVQRLAVVRPVGDIVRVDAEPGSRPLVLGPVVEGA